jgi:hypothetical protein
MIHLLHIMSLQLSQQDLEGSLILGDEETTTRITVDAVHECWTERETIILSSEIVLHLIDDIGLGCLVISGMHVDPGWLVHHHQVLILIEYRERDFRCFLGQILRASG